MQKQYRLFVDGKEEGVFNQREVSRRIGVTAPTVIKWAASGKLYREKYRIVEIAPLETKGVLGEEWAKRRLLTEYNWDRIRFSLNPRAKGWKEYAET